MKNPFLWLTAAIGLLVWSAYELYPPTGRDIIEQFEREAENTQDPNFRTILAKAREDAAKPGARSFTSLLEAAGTNSLERYFPRIEIPAGRETNRFILNRLQRDSLGKIKLGLDLQGGMSFVVQMDTNDLKEASARNRALDQAVEILRRRVDRFGVAEPLIQRAGEDTIEIQVPGLTDAEKDAVKTQIEKAAFLEFCLVHPDNDRLLTEGLVPPGYRVLTEVRKDREGRSQSIPMLVKKKPERGLTGSFIVNAAAIPDPMTGEPKIEFEFNSEGARIFADITREFQPREVGGGTQFTYLAIVLDGVLYSAPRILGEIPGGRGVITGNFDVKEAYELANVLMNPLEAKVKILQEYSVAATLGADSVKSGMQATMVGMLLVVGFMLGYYLLAGAVANVALLMNLFMLMGVMCAVETTLTMPGIAGILLTAGMAVDANVLIYERVREELAAGKSLRGALSAGYGKAFWTIFDSNLTTLISAVIMIWLGSGPVKGFGVTLTIGICVSMFTALVVTRLLFDFFLARGILKEKLPMMSLIKGTKIDFMKAAVPAFILSWSLIIIGIGYGIYRGKDVLAVDFAGGDAITFSYKAKPSLVEVRDALTRSGIADAQIVPKSSAAGGLEVIQVTVAFGDGEKVQKALPKELPNAGLEVKEIDRKGPAVGEEIQLSALKSVVLALFGILVYVAFRYEFSFSVGAVVAIIHDVLMTVGWFFLTGRQLSGPMVAAILTIIGFSINDTIVIFDRIREDLKLGIKGSFRDLLNLAVNQTLSRTIITSGTVLLATLALYLFGGSVINDFAFTFLVGIVTGTYSTIYIASAIVLWWHKGQRPSIGSTAQPMSPVVPIDTQTQSGRA
jgi:SecD/SecF fusion protein